MSRIEDEAKYNRNAFIFNLCFVFEREAELSGFEPIVRKTARILQAMEARENTKHPYRPQRLTVILDLIGQEASSLLSSPPPSFQIANLLEQLYLDLNAFSETRIPLHNADLDLVLFPLRPNPQEVKNWDVPIPISPLESIKNGSWDMTLFKVGRFPALLSRIAPDRRIIQIGVHVYRWSE